ncbi:lycopene cyclase family protein [Nocardia sp. CDC186]|uniref:Lycopene cyclase family protein n=1 Tax=Nocardia implantans TaxID=3108168 RepID=A0ABU6AZK2_9NOCA|nr:MULTISPECIES: lycopene cyclase family protein [unclassified Nocardia]MBF6191364.1 lycopene cyclase [Nocardia beijingensis]MEA3533005.1 lycopene cyclase family protein [Nocardia sp. CDC192]MEB3512937.1 lycopene cyclase family protein [Nocardia sp. CDC186]
MGVSSSGVSGGCVHTASVGLEIEVCVVGLGPTGRALAHRAMCAGLYVTAIDPRPERLWSPTYACWVDELPRWLPASVIAARMEAMTAWTSTEHRIDRPYCVLSKPGLRDALPLDDATVIAGRATRVDAHEVELADGRIIRAAVVFDARGLPSVKQRRAVSAHGVFVSAETAAPMLAEGEGLLLDWRPDNGAGPHEPPSFLYAVPVGDGTVVFEETSLGLRGGMPQHELRKRLRKRLATHGIRLTGDEPSESPHYPLDQPPPKSGVGTVIPFGSGGGMMHPTTSYSVADSLALVDTAVAAVCDERDPVAELWPWQARLVYWMRMRGLWGLGRLTTDQSIAMFESFFQASPRRQRALLSAHDDYTALGAVLFNTVAHLRPFRWRYDLVGWTNRNRWVGYDFDPPEHGGRGNNGQAGSH